VTSRSLKFLLRAVAIVCLLMVYFVSKCWFMFFYIFLWPVVGLIHFMVHSKVASRVTSVSGSTMALVFASHLFLIAGFLLQIDEDDGAKGIWLMVTDLLFQLSIIPDRHIPSWWPYSWGLFVSVGVFVPAILTWPLLLELTKPVPANK